MVEGGIVLFALSAEKIRPGQRSGKEKNGEYAQVVPHSFCKDR